MKDTSKACEFCFRRRKRRGSADRQDFEQVTFDASAGFGDDYPDLDPPVTKCGTDVHARCEDICFQLPRQRYRQLNCNILAFGWL